MGGYWILINEDFGLGGSTVEIWFISECYCLSDIICILRKIIGMILISIQLKSYLEKFG